MEKLEVGTVTNGKTWISQLEIYPVSLTLRWVCVRLSLHLLVTLTFPCYSEIYCFFLLSLGSCHLNDHIFFYLFSCRLSPTLKDKGLVSFAVLSPSSKTTTSWCCMHSRAPSNPFILPQMRMFAWRHIFMIIFLFCTKMVTETTVILAVQNGSHKTIS